jgi:hypothetical protein
MPKVLVELILSHVDVKFLTHQIVNGVDGPMMFVRLKKLKQSSEVSVSQDQTQDYEHHEEESGEVSSW